MTYNVTAHIMRMTVAERDAAVVTITRDRLYKSPLRNERYAWRWTYSYSVNGEPSVGYGTGLGDLRSMLRYKLGPKATLVETWKAAK